MSVRRCAAWYLRHDPGGFVRGIEGELDPIDVEIAAVRRLQWEETRDRLAQLGYDTSRFGPPVPIHPCEERSFAHPTSEEIYEDELRARATGRPKPGQQLGPRNPGLVVRVGCGQVLRVY